MLTPPGRQGWRILLLLLILFAALGATPSASGQAAGVYARVPLNAPSASGSENHSARLEILDEDRRWLWRRRNLRVGVSGPDNPPFDLLGNGDRFEGVSAEYLALLAEWLRLDIRVVSYPDRASALEGLRQGEVDLLTTATPQEGRLPGLARTQPYAEDQPVLIRRADLPKVDGEQGTILAIPDGYASEASDLSTIDGHRLVPQPSLLTAMAALVLGEADAVLANGDAVASQLGQSPLEGHEQVTFLAPRVEGLGFLLREEEPRLLALINGALAAVPAPWRAEVRATWARGAARLNEAATVPLEPTQQRWIKAHPEVRVGYLRDFAPLTFMSEKGEFQGLAADLLARIAQRTGLRLRPVGYDTHASLMAALEGGQVDMAASMARDAAEQAGLQSSRSWLNAVPVMITAADAPSARLDALAGQGVAVPAALGLVTESAQRWPGVRWVQSDTARHALESVMSGEVKGAVVPYLQAQAALAGAAGKSLRIGAPLAVPPRRYGFAVSAGHAPLLTVLDAALASIGPASLADLSRRWRGEIHVGALGSNESRWVMPAFGIAGVMLGLAVIWIRLLKRQVCRRRRAEQALKDQLEFMRVMIDGTPHPVYVRDREGRLLDCNVSYLQALGVSQEEVVGQKVTRIPLTEAQAREYETLYQKVIRDGEPIVEDRHLHLQSGRRMTVLHWMLPYRASNGSIVGLIGGWIDITERQRLYDALEAAKEEADSANRAKSRFLAAASHEIRTPMNAVLGMLELALRKAETGELDTLALRVASESASSLLELLSDILDISRIEAGHLTLNPRPVQVNALARQVVQLYQVRAREKNLALRLEVQSDMAWGVLLDPLRFQQVLGNLLSNAIKFTREGSVRVRLVGEATASELTVRLVVEDTGIGIPQADLQRLCQPYQQAGNHQLSGRAGAGLGLSITHHLCRIMGGQLSLHSREGEGTRVEAMMRLPICEVIAPEPVAASPSAPQASLCILVVDDHEPNRLLLAQQLSYLGHRVVVAADGAQGLREWCGRGGFDAVICDCEMPGLDGYDLARAIRLEEQRKGLPRCRLLAYTADVASVPRARCREVGFDDCLTKPLGLDSLAAALAPRSEDPAGDAQPQASAQGAEALLALAGGCASSARRLRESLLKALQQDEQRLRTLPAACPEIDDVVHRVKGGARIVGAAALVECCEAVERNERPVEALLMEMEALQRQLRQMRFSQGSASEPQVPLGLSPATQPKPAA